MFRDTGVVIISVLLLATFVPLAKADTLDVAMTGGTNWVQCGAMLWPCSSLTYDIQFIATNNNPPNEVPNYEITWLTGTLNGVPLTLGGGLAVWNWGMNFEVEIPFTLTDGSGEGYFYRDDMVTNSMMIMGPTADTIVTSQIEYTTPEPSEFLLLFIALGAVGLIAWRRGN